MIVVDAGSMLERVRLLKRRVLGNDNLFLFFWGMGRSKTCYPSRELHISWLKPLNLLRNASFVTVQLNHTMTILHLNSARNVYLSGMLHDLFIDDSTSKSE